MRLLLIAALFTLCGCQKPTTSDTLFHLHPPAKTGVNFSNQLFPSPDLNIITFEYFNNGAGVALGDVDRDGQTDIFFTGNMTNATLYRNKGSFTFADITETAGIDTKGRWATGAHMVDLNEDGWLDIYVSCAGPYGPDQRANLLFINQQDGTFREQAAEYGLDDRGHTTQTVFLDYDRDGDLDAYLLTNIMEEDLGPNVIRPKKTKGQSPNTDRLYRNDNGTFTNVSAEAGITIEGYGLGVAVEDINRDGWLDIYVSNDYLSNDLLYLNQGDGTFKDVAGEAFRHTSYSSMGTDVADINNDGWPDVLSVDMLPPDNKRRKLMIGSIRYDRFRSELLTGYAPQYMRNTLQLHRGVRSDSVPVFSELGQLAGIHSTDWSWSPLLADLDNDGWKDLLITNGYPKDVTNMDFASYKMATMMKGQWDRDMKEVLFQALEDLDGAFLPNYVFRNQGGYQFTKANEEWGITHPSYSHGAAVGDLDNDGDLDYVVNNTDAPAFIYENRQQNHHFLQIAPSLDIPRALLYGARFQLFTPLRVQTQTFQPARGYQSSVEPILHFGLGSVTQVDSLVIHWSDGSRQVEQNIVANQRMTIRLAKPSPVKRTIAREQSWLTDITSDLALDFTHRESHYADFKVQSLLWQKYSQLGPALAVGDINGDKLDDIFAGGAFRQPGTILIQTPDGQFTKRELPGVEHFGEDVAAVFLDADQDGDTDLYVGSGGSEFPSGSPYYQDRLYWNDGKGHFTLAEGALPALTISTGCVVPADYDQDGDTDLFVGARIHPQNYAEVPTSFLLENQGGQFIATKLLPEAGQLGRVTAALWSDLNDDQRPDLVLAGEWMPLTILYNLEGGFEKKEIGNTRGLWNCLRIADLDGDGDDDLLAGNLGWNHPFGDSLRKYQHDFDQNGQPEALLTIELEGKEVPWHYRKDLLQWLSPLKKTYKDFTSYAEAGWKDMFTQSIRNGSEQQIIDQFASGWLENTVDGWTFHPFPTEAQWAPINDFTIRDLDGDERPEILGIGNTFAPEPTIGRMDASYGLVLTQKKQQWVTVPWQTSGLFTTGEGKRLDWIYLPAEDAYLLLVAGNNSPIRVFRVAPRKVLNGLQ